jgi:hypothetical protein
MKIARTAGLGMIIAQSAKKVKGFLIIRETNLDFFREIVYNMEEAISNITGG